MLESDFALNIMSKFLFYLCVLPEDISLIRNSVSDYPEDAVQMYVSYLHLDQQIAKNCSQKILESFRTFKETIAFGN